MTNVIQSLRLAGKSNFRFPNFLDRSAALKIIQLESAQCEFAKLAYIAYRFAIRIPSEALPLRRAYCADSLGRFTPQKEKALIAVRDPPGEEKLISKLPPGRTYKVGAF